MALDRFVSVYLPIKYYNRRFKYLLIIFLTLCIIPAALTSKTLNRENCGDYIALTILLSIIIISILSQIIFYPLISMKLIRIRKKVSQIKIDKNFTTHSKKGN